MSVRPFIFTLYLALASVASAADLTIAHVYTGWREAASFKRISEYFDGKENTNGATVLRTHPDQRAGYYFLVRTKNSGTTFPVDIKLQLITQANSTLLTYQFPSEFRNGSAVIQLGLTGNDWPDSKANPVAWRIEILAKDGSVLSADQSYLWENKNGRTGLHLD